jgi:hypothetical protein
MWRILRENQQRSQGRGTQVLAREVSVKTLVRGISIIMVISFISASATLLAQSKTLTATGKVTAINLQKQTISFSGQGTGGGTMQTPGGGTLVMPDSYDVQLTGVVDNNAVIKIGDTPATLKDIHVGDTVTIRYLPSGSSGSAVVVKAIRKKK